MGMSRSLIPLTPMEFAMFQLFQYIVVSLALLVIPVVKLARWFWRNSYISNYSRPYETENYYGKHANW